MIIRNVFSAVIGISLIFLSGCSSSHFAAQDQSSDSATFHGSRRVFPEKIPPTGKRFFIFSPKDLGWGAYSADGILVGYGRASGGSDWCKQLGRQCHTPIGVFSIRSKGSYDCVSGKYPLPTGGAHMPYCMFFLNNYAIHGAPPEYVPSHNASHGCIRITTRAAKWLRDHFIRIGTRVKVTSY
ncbi:MAG: L,D-transpeptidase [Gammaproteobacteria bacterium CG_4_10_14_0_8_um_filter_38_16]|nr:MAG: L,D-transpeptidase [Gammaproteobacteria bacterium CG_4_10_14_0_8_um_filter_38_16]PJA02843.1 MAG: L,D-transpeptidase [Gammaproteobacteria bacterium CG_4_10_14_0_2_um_filter_38_22]PJB10307.1 MAG: L,D-transpeptidase [Gammaproteobacteria bacterium CG_4_9_14_3_um_filter_38_9]